MSPEQLELMQHALGMDEHGRFEGGRQYRNYYCAAGDSEATCRALVALGHMREGRSSAITGGEPVFHATPAGIAATQAASPPPPVLTRAQRRYQAFLDEDSGLSFGEWLRSGAERPRHACGW